MGQGRCISIQSDSFLDRCRTLEEEKQERSKYGQYNNVNASIVIALSTKHEQIQRNLDRWNKGRRDYQKYPILKDDTDFPDWKDRYVTYAKTEHMGRMVDKTKGFKDLKDKHDIDLWNLQEQHMKLALHHALQTDVSKAIYQQYKSSPKGIWNHLVDY